MTVYKCKNWTFVPDSQEIIYADGRKAQLPSRLNSCLLSLITSAGKTVSYDELLLKVWGTTHKDASTISSVISEIRKLVGCGNDGQKIIVTLPKRGYRFTQPVEVVDAEVVSEPPKTNQPKSTSTTPELLDKSEAGKETQNGKESTEPSVIAVRTEKSTWKWLVIVLTIIALLLAVNTALNLTENTQVSQSYSDFEVLSHEVGREDEFDVSNDGRWLVYVNKAPNVKPSLVVKELSTGRTQQLVAKDNHYFGSPTFSRDVTQIVFHKQTLDECEVWLADFSSFHLDSNNTRKLTDCGKGGFWSTTAFSKDGNHVYFSRANSLTDPFKVFQLDLRSLFERSITSPASSGRGDYAFSLSPDGKLLAIVRNVLWQESHILVRDTSGNQTEKVAELPYLIDRVAWLSNEELVYCDKNDELWSYELVTKQQTSLAQIGFSCNYPVVAAEQLFAIKKVRIKNAIWTLKKGINDPFTIQPLIESPYYDFNAMFGANDSLYFISDRSGEEKLWQKTVQGFKQHEEVQLPANARELEFSIDTNSLYGLSQKRLFRYDLDLNELEWLSKKKHEVFNFSITDDGQLIFSEGNKEYWTLKSLDLFTLKISALNLNAFSARQSNGQLYFTKFHDKGLWKKDLQTGVITKVFENINIKFNTFWDIWNNEKLIWATDNKFNIFDLNTGHLVSDELTYQGHVGFLKCSSDRLMCTFSFRENDESEIIKFK
ncbi:winged helix-turn-helix domain-containing protein [Thalassotalea atypica]|uniref:winged helix-turn-helix domain-containing protein n=1 Tax=Thalassotalea atypica TaxID=2054316 RepID=UPI002572D1E5|nr:winged helix-turn-helix domain-containing protein [Thalassotalea atypica]